MVVYKSLDRKVQLGNSKSGHGRLRELRITAQMGFQKGGHN